VDDPAKSPRESVARIFHARFCNWFRIGDDEAKKRHHLRQTKQNERKNHDYWLALAPQFFFHDKLVMKFVKFIIGVFGVWTALLLNAPAQTNVLTVTNVVTLTVTNVVYVTNIVAQVLPPVKVVVVAAAGKTNKIVVPVKYPWVSSITAGLTLTRGNSDSLLTTVKFVSDKKTPVNEFSLDADGAYGSANGVANTAMAHGFAQWNHLFSDKWYGYLRGEVLHDDIAQVRYRATVTSGVGYYLIKQTNMTLTAETGPGIVIERVGNVDTTYATMRFAEHFERKFNKNSARVWENVEFLPQVDKPSDYLINSEVGIESSLYKNVSLQVYSDDNFNSQPAAGLKRNDVKLVSAVSYKF
jgi:putative salt-induced outer membrane protein YdiY